MIPQRGRTGWGYREREGKRFMMEGGGRRKENKNGVECERDEIDFEDEMRWDGIRWDDGG